MEDHVPKTQTSTRWLLGWFVLGIVGSTRPRDTEPTLGRTQIACWVDPAWYRMFGVAVPGTNDRCLVFPRETERAGSSGWGLDEGRGSSGGPGRLIGSGARTKYRIIFGSMWLVRIHLCCLLAVVSLVALTSLTVAAVAQDLV